MKRTAYLGCSFLLTAALAIPVLARPQAAPAQNDGDAYTNFYVETDPAKKADLGEKFFTTFKSSQYADPVFRTTVDIYASTGKWAKVIELVGKVDQLFPTMTASPSSPETFPLRSASPSGLTASARVYNLDGTLGGAAVRTKLYESNNGKDRPGALIEDVVAVGGGFLIAFLVSFV